ncbi:hypothetical protein B0H67DRAFT_548146 [Lasiosphaeris hirsuta]|uniref:Uncharacterized protein n=1 Tax=Lasiosphaeris hirsuta TaxID=260670 RepID=A0AA40B9W4_9PEZI|nr:hypothetical protein B0H67DRAFT_548146 [Lasiosphaeris hirsuta]
MSKNRNSVGSQGEFHNRIIPSEPTTSKGVGNDRLPGFRAQTFPPGTAPNEHTFIPNPMSEIPGQALNPNMVPSLRTGALDMPGATSQTVYKDSYNVGPMEGQTQREWGLPMESRRSRAKNWLLGT